MEESNQALSEDPPSKPILLCGKTLDEILANRRGPAVDSSKEPWWAPPAPEAETIVTLGDLGEQPPFGWIEGTLECWTVEALERLWNDLFPPINGPQQDE